MGVSARKRRSAFGVPGSKFEVPGLFALIGPQDLSLGWSEAEPQELSTQGNAP